MNKTLPPLSIYGQAILDEFKNKSGGHIIVSALAGSGKSTVILQICNQMTREDQSQTLVMAFNKSIANIMKERLPENISCNTVHALGHKILFENNIKGEVKSDKYRNIIKHILEKENYDFNSEDAGAYLSNTLASLKMCQLTLTDPLSSEFAEQLIRYEIEEDKETSRIVKEALDIGSSENGVIEFGISFEDMLYLPIFLNLSPKTKFKYIFIDECQDLSNALAELCMKHHDGDGKIVAVGDENQSIYGFAYSNVDSYNTLKNRLKAKEMPLNICYRCPVQHIDIVKKMVPAIEAKPGAIHGFVEYLEYDESFEKVKEYDYVICRKNAPLITYAFNLLKMGKNVNIAGRAEITSQIFSSVKNILNKKKFADFSDLLTKWHASEVAKIMLKTNPELQIENLNDKMECMKILYDKAIDSGVKNITGFKKFCDELFPDKSRAVKLLSVHRMKGSENERIFILDYKHIKLRLSQKHLQHQETNLKYVAYTRSKNYLGLIDIK